MDKEDQKLFDSMPDPVIEEIDNSELDQFKLDEKKRKKELKKYYKDRFHKTCNHCSYDGWLLNDKQFLCPACGFPMAHEPLESKVTKVTKPIQEDIITDTETDQLCCM
jgi:ribosomal protein L37E